MIAPSRSGWLLLVACALPIAADVTNCACDASKPVTMEARECSLCREADKQTGEVFFLKDNNPRKPNRWLALPKDHGDAGHPLYKLPKAKQAALWTAAITKAKELWGDEWGLAYNAQVHRTQCHGHIHIGKLLKGLAPGKFYDVSSVDQILIPADNTGVWVHPVGSMLRVHTGEGITETVLLR
ncbi:MAG: hypothetical protein U0Q16_13560 [Bryobacteraceae bacterium]